MQSIVSPSIASVFLFLGLVSLYLADVVNPDDWWIHGVWCIVATLPIVLIFKRLFKVGTSVMLVDHRIVLCFAFCLYFIVGSALLAYGPEADVASVINYYPVGVNEVLRTNAVNSIGLFLLLMVTYFLKTESLIFATKRAAKLYSRINFLLIFFIFSIAGLVAQYYVNWIDSRVMLGATDVVVSGIARTLAKFSLVAIYLAFSYDGKGYKKYRIAGYVLIVLTSPAGLLMASKTDFLLPICSALGGIATRRGNFRSLLVGIIILGTGFVFSGGAVSTLRSEQTGYTSFDANSRLESILRSGSSRSEAVGTQKYNLWGRLCYAIPQAASIDLYDRGNGGDDFNKLLWVFVPRVLWPSKPIMTESSMEFHEKVSGTRHASVGIGIFSSGYYNGGWLGVIFASFLCGVVIAATSAIASSVFSVKSVILYPLALMGVYIAFRIDGGFLNDYVGAFVYILALILIPTFGSLAIRKYSF